MNVPAKKSEQPTPEIIRDIVVRGDLSRLNPQQETQYILDICEALHMDWRTQPFEFLTLGGKRVLYAKRAATDQLRKINGISIEVSPPQQADGLLTVHARAKDKTGRTDEDFGVVAFKGGGNEIAANTIMKAVTKAKRRVTLSISGLGFLDETELPSVGTDEPTGEVIGQDSLNILIRECDETDTDKRKLCKHFGVPSMAELTPDQFAEAMAQLKRKREAIDNDDAQGESLL